MIPVDEDTLPMRPPPPPAPAPALKKQGTGWMALLVEANGDFFPINLNVQTPLELFGQHPYIDFPYKKDGRPHNARNDKDGNPLRPEDCLPNYPKERMGDPLLNRTSLIHDPDQHGVPGPRKCFEAWTLKCGPGLKPDNATARAIVQGLPCFTPIALERCKGRMLFIGWGGRSLTPAELDMMVALAKAVDIKMESAAQRSTTEDK
jgi:hypothetical protein